MDSPCIDVCTIDPESKLCAGCGRSLDEIAAWSGLSDSERGRIMDQLKARMRAAGLTQPAGG